MEYCENGDLQNLIQKQKNKNQPFPESQIWSFLSQICSALYTIHHHKPAILHRDLKPSNIFIDGNFNLKLGDFGLAKVVEEEMFAQTGLQGIQYISPEQLNENIFTEKTDVWAFSCLVYELMNLEQPFSGSNQMQIAFKISQSNIDRQLNKIYSVELQRLVMWGLEKDYRKRPSIEDLVNTPEISFYLRQKRLQDNQTILDKRQKENEIKREKLDQREQYLQDQIRNMEQIYQDNQTQIQKYQFILDESEKEELKIMDKPFFNLNPFSDKSTINRNLTQRNNSHDFGNQKQYFTNQDNDQNQKNQNNLLKMNYQPKSEFQNQNQFFMQVKKNGLGIDDQQNMNKIKQQTMLKNKYIQRTQNNSYIQRQ